MTHINVAGRIKTQPAQQTGTLGEALKAKLEQAEQAEKPEQSVTITLTPLPNSQRIHFALDNGSTTKRGNFINSTIAAHVISGLLDKHPTLTVERRDDA